MCVGGTHLDSQAARVPGSIPLCAESGLCALIRAFRLGERHGAERNVRSSKAVPGEAVSDETCRCQGRA